MSHLEDTILKIIELKQKGLDDLVIAQNLSLEPETIQLYEKSAKDSITEAMNKGDKDYQKLAEKLQISPVAFNVIKNYYQITPLRAEEKSRKKRKSKEKGKLFEERLEEINNAITVKGCDSVDSLARELDLTRWTVNRLLKLAGINYIPKRKPSSLKDKKEKRKKIKIEKIQEAILQGNDSPKSLAKFFGINYQTAIEWQDKLGFCFMSGEYRLHPK